MAVNGPPWKPVNYRILVTSRPWPMGSVINSAFGRLRTCATYFVRLCEIMLSATTIPPSRMWCRSKERG